MKALIFSIAFLLSLSAYAFDEYEGYDDIVDRLTSDDDTFYNGYTLYGAQFTKAHAGIGMSQTFYNSSSAGGDSNGQRHGGMMIALGVDLLSRKWSVEGAFHNFGRSQGDNASFQLKEVALKLLYKPNIVRSWFLRVGGGLSSRFLQVTRYNDQSISKQETPSMLGTVGVDTYITNGISFGIDLNLKNSLIQDTIDRRSVDVSLRLDTHF